MRCSQCTFLTPDGATCIMNSSEDLLKFCDKFVSRHCKNCLYGNGDYCRFFGTETGAVCTKYVSVYILELIPDINYNPT